MINTPIFSINPQLDLNYDQIPLIEIQNGHLGLFSMTLPPPKALGQNRRAILKHLLYLDQPQNLIWVQDYY